MFTDAEKTDLRRFCGIPAFGAMNSQAFGYRYFTQSGTFEFRINNLSTAEETVIRSLYLPNLQTLEAAIVNTSSNLDTDSAAVWKHNKNELKDRRDLYDYYRNELCNFIGNGKGPGLKAGGLTLVV